MILRVWLCDWLLRFEEQEEKPAHYSIALQHRLGDGPACFASARDFGDGWDRLEGVVLGSGAVALADQIRGALGQRGWK